MEKTNKLSTVAVVGAGVAGITAAYLLDEHFDVTLFEANDYIGGHTNTITVQDPQSGELAVDTGFIVCNPTNYPSFYKFLDRLNVARRDSNMSFGYFCERTGIGYTGPALHEFLGQPGNFLSPSFVKMLFEQRRFNKYALRDLNSGILSEIPLRDYVKSIGCSEYFMEHYLFPLAGAIWSSSEETVNSFPASTFVNFFRNHGMLQLSKRPNWQTVAGGSHSYVKSFQKVFKGKILVSTPIEEIERENGIISVKTRSGELFQFDHVILAAHADQSLKILKSPSDEELNLLGAWNYSCNDTVLHTDPAVMPENRKLWASWNYYRSSEMNVAQPVAITYYMNRLQGLDAKQDYFVTLNRTDNIAPESIIFRTKYQHPVYTAEAVSTQKSLRKINGQNNTYFCGSYLGYGFHEDAVSSAVRTAAKLGAEL
jgi:uncharacterized protein